MSRLRAGHGITEASIQVQASAQASCGFVSGFQQVWKNVTKRVGIQEPTVNVMILKSRRSVLVSLCVLFAALSPVLVAQTGNVVLSTNTTWATGTYTLTNLSVVNGATLTVGGGSSVGAGPGGAPESSSAGGSHGGLGGLAAAVVAIEYAGKSRRFLPIPFLITTLYARITAVSQASWRCQYTE